MADENQKKEAPYPDSEVLGALGTALVLEHRLERIGRDASFIAGAVREARVSLVTALAIRSEEMRVTEATRCLDILESLARRAEDLQ